MGRYQIADARNPYMGLGNRTCQDPAYWCRLHRVWLSEEDVRRRRCRAKEDYDMMGTHRCGSLEKRGRICSRKS